LRIQLITSVPAANVSRCTGIKIAMASTLVRRTKQNILRDMQVFQSQMTLRQCLPRQVQLSAIDHAALKKRQMHYCVDGFHAFKSVEHAGLLKLMQSCADLGAKYGKFDVSEAVCGKKNS